MFNTKRNLDKKKAEAAEAHRLVEILYLGLLHRKPEPSILKALTELIQSGQTPSQLALSIMNAPEFRRRVDLSSSKEFSSLLNFENLKKNYSNLKFFGKTAKGKIKNITYFCPITLTAAGGVKVLCHHVELLSEYFAQDLACTLYFPENPHHSIEWLDVSAHIKTDGNFNIEDTLIIIPEIWALSIGRQLAQSGIRYAILVQNGYYLFDEIQKGDGNALKEINEIYKKATKIITVSKLTTETLALTFKNLDEKIIQISPSINNNKFHFDSKYKKNIISYMPRKLATHSDWIINYLTLNKLAGWEIVAIDGKSENDVANLLNSSKIFLSFSDREGLSLPPLEAAICGNIVIGYTGEGAREYWSGSQFIEVEQGNLLEFIKKIEEQTLKLTTADFTSSITREIETSANLLADKYSRTQEKEALEKFVQSLHN